MSYLFCVVPVCPVRSEPSHKSEQVSQLIFGETAQFLEASGDFVKVRCHYDSYDGWCQATQLQEAKSVIEADNNIKICANWVNEIIINGKKMFIPFASVVSFENNFSRADGKNEIVYNGKFLKPSEQLFTDETVKKLTYTFINSPYLWGGRSVFGIDCSGFTQLVFKCLNIPLLRDASQQATQGEAIGFLMEAKCGDLVFFDNEAGKITHVGILLDAGTIIHSSGKVRVDTIDNFGIVNSDTGKRTHNLRVIKRMVV